MRRGPLTDRAWLAVRLALDEADRQGRPVGTAHLLLGLVLERENLLLAETDTDSARVEANLRRLWETGPEEPDGAAAPPLRSWWRPPGFWDRVFPRRPDPGAAFTGDARGALARSAEFAAANGCLYVGPEHLLLGLAATEGSRAARVLEHCGAGLPRLEQALSRRRGR